MKPAYRLHRHPRPDRGRRGVPAHGGPGAADRAGRRRRPGRREHAALGRDLARPGRGTGPRRLLQPGARHGGGRCELPSVVRRLAAAGPPLRAVRGLPLLLRQGDRVGRARPRPGLQLSLPDPGHALDPAPDPGPGYGASLRGPRRRANQARPPAPPLAGRLRPDRVGRAYYIPHWCEDPTTGRRHRSLPLWLSVATGAARERAPGCIQGVRGVEHVFEVLETTIEGSERRATIRRLLVVRSGLEMPEALAPLLEDGRILQRIRRPDARAGPGGRGPGLGLPAGAAGPRGRPGRGLAAG